jgi:hypothetical protein
MLLSVQLVPEILDIASRMSRSYWTLDHVPLKEKLFGAKVSNRWKDDVVEAK